MSCLGFRSILGWERAGRLARPVFQANQNSLSGAIPGRCDEFVLRLPGAAFLRIVTAMKTPPTRFRLPSQLACLAALLLAAAPPVKAAEIRGQRVFTAGHSFHVFLPPILADIAGRAEVDGHVVAGLQGIGGSRVIQHWELPEGKNKVKPALATGKVDVLTLSPIYLPDDGIEQLAKYALEHNPDIRVTVQEFWMPFDSQPAWAARPKTIDRDAKTAAELRAAHAGYFQSMDEQVARLNRQFGKTALYVVPVGQAVLGLREKIIQGEAPGLTKQSELFTDVLGHVHAQVKVLSGYCHFAVIYRRSPVGLAMPTALAKVAEAEKLNRLLQELAWEAVTAHPLSGVKR